MMMQGLDSNSAMVRGTMIDVSELLLCVNALLQDQ